MDAAKEKQLDAFKQNVAYMVERYGVERLLFFTMTTPQKEYEMDAFQRVLNSFASNVLRPMFGPWSTPAVGQPMPRWCPTAAAVLGIHRRDDGTAETGYRGSLHAHGIFVAPVDVRTGFNHAEAYDDTLPSWKRYRSASSWLKGLWRDVRAVTNYNGKRPDAAYPLVGRFEFLPLRKEHPDAVARYIVGEYLIKTWNQRHQEDRGAKLIRYWGDSKRVYRGFASNLEHGINYRAKLRQFSIVECQCPSYEALRAKHRATFKGKNASKRRRAAWWWANKDAIRNQILVEYRTKKHAAADGSDCHLPPSDDASGAVRVVPPGYKLEVRYFLEEVDGEEKAVPLVVAVRGGHVLTQSVDEAVRRRARLAFKLSLPGGAGWCVAPFNEEQVEAILANRIEGFAPLLVPGVAVPRAPVVDDDDASGGVVAVSSRSAIQAGRSTSGALPAQSSRPRIEIQSELSDGGLFPARFPSQVRC